MCLSPMTWNLRPRLESLCAGSPTHDHMPTLQAEEQGQCSLPCGHIRHQWQQKQTAWEAGEALRCWDISAWRHSDTQSLAGMLSGDTDGSGWIFFFRNDTFPSAGPVQSGEYDCVSLLFFTVERQRWQSLIYDSSSYRLLWRSLQPLKGSHQKSDSCFLPFNKLIYFLNRSEFLVVEEESPENPFKHSLLITSSSEKCVKPNMMTFEE